MPIPIFVYFVEYKVMKVNFDMEPLENMVLILEFMFSKVKYNCSNLGTYWTGSRVLTYPMGPQFKSGFCSLETI